MDPYETLRAENRELRGAFQATQQVVSKLQTQIQACQTTITQLQTQNLDLHVRLAHVEARTGVFPGTLAETDSPAEQQRKRTRSEDETAHGEKPLTFKAITSGDAAVLEYLLDYKGADINQTIGDRESLVNYCASMGRPECARLLIERGAKVTSSDEDDVDAGMFVIILLLVALDPEKDFQEGDYILTADLLIDAGVPPDQWGHRERNAVMNLLQNMQFEEGSKLHAEIQGIKSLVEGRYWHAYGHNPFLRSSSVEHLTWLLMTGAANGEHSHVEQTRVRSIKPVLRRGVMSALGQSLGVHEFLMDVLLMNTRRPNNQSPFALLAGHERPILGLIADMLGVRGRTLRNVREAKRIFDDLATGNVEREYQAGDW